MCPSWCPRCAAILAAAQAIVYSLNLLGGQAVPMATVGQDGVEYVQRLQNLGIATHCIREVPDSYTAQAKGS